MQPEKSTYKIENQTYRKINRKLLLAVVIVLTLVTATLAYFLLINESNESQEVTKDQPSIVEKKEDSSIKDTQQKELPEKEIVLMGTTSINGSADQFMDFEDNPCRAILEDTEQVIAVCTENEAQKENSIYIHNYSIAELGIKDDNQQYIVVYGGEGGESYLGIYYIDLTKDELIFVEDFNYYVLYPSDIQYRLGEEHWYAPVKPKDRCQEFEDNLDDALSKLPECVVDWETLEQKRKEAITKSIMDHYSGEELLIKYLGYDPYAN